MGGLLASKKALGGCEVDLNTRDSCGPRPRTGLHGSVVLRQLKIWGLTARWHDAWSFSIAAGCLEIQPVRTSRGSTQCSDIIICDFRENSLLFVSLLSPATKIHPVLYYID